MLPLVLLAFVAGSFVLQQQALLPSSAALIALLLLPPLAAALVWRLRLGPVLRLACAVMMAAAVGFACAGLWAQVRLADELAFADEGKDLRVTGVIASLPAQFERGQRFEFNVEQVEGTVHVPARLSLAWYTAQVAVRPAQRLRADGRDGVSAWRQQGRRYWHNQPGVRALAQVNEEDASTTGRPATGYDAEAESVTDAMQSTDPTAASFGGAVDQQPEVQPSFD